MNGYIDWSSRECDASCASEVIQISQDVAQYAQMATAETASSRIALETTMSILDEIKDLTENIEGQVIQLRIDILKLNKNITRLSDEVENSMVPTLDDNIFKLLIAIISAITVCIVVCQLVIFNTSRLESRKEERRRIILQQNKNKRIHPSV